MVVGVVEGVASYHPHQPRVDQGGVGGPAQRLSRWLDAGQHPEGLCGGNREGAVGSWGRQRSRYWLLRVIPEMALSKLNLFHLNNTAKNDDPPSSPLRTQTMRSRYKMTRIIVPGFIFCCCYCFYLFPPVFCSTEWVSNRRKEEALRPRCFCRRKTHFRNRCISETFYWTPNVQPAANWKLPLWW